LTIVVFKGSIGKRKLKRQKNKVKKLTLAQKCVLGILCSGTLTISAGTFVTIRSATGISVEDARRMKMVPSDDWIGTLDTPATATELDKFEYHRQVIFPAKGAIFAFGVFGLLSIPSYFVLLKLIYHLLGGKPKDSQ
jgi:hypothetical protein